MRALKHARMWAIAGAMGLLATGPGQASNYNYYFDANGRLVASTRIQGLNENYAYDSADNRSSLNTGHQNTPTTAGQIQANQGLTRYQSVTSTDGRFFITVQNDGNVVLYQNGSGALWSTSTVGKQTASFGMQADGNLVAHDAYGNGIWASNTSGHAGAYLAVETNGNMDVMYNGSSIWSSGTCCH